MKGVRGFSDRAAVKLPSGKPVFYQPIDQKNLSAYMLPWHADPSTTSSICMSAPQMDYTTDIRMHNGGRCDSWNTARNPGMGMAYFTAADMPYYYALADQVTIGDQYHQSTFTQTNPNRLHLFSGSNGLSVGQTPFLDNSEPNPGHTWTTVAEVLEAANISWRIYQQEDNFDEFVAVLPLPSPPLSAPRPHAAHPRPSTPHPFPQPASNGCAWFANFQKARPGDALYDKGMARVDDFVAEFAKDVLADSLPQVSWLVGPANLSEHAAYHPSAGEDLSARLIKALAANPDVYKKTAFVLTYDEGGQFFDHAVPYTIPLAKDGSDGDSTVPVEGEDFLGLPIGPGFRVPFMAISPWSRGGYVVSELFDHTSTIQLIEKRFNVSVPTISAWRRAMLGDLTSAFNFSAPDYSVDWVAALPDTSAYPAESITECDTLPPPRVPAVQSMPAQPAGTRRARALPYAVTARFSCSAAGLALTLNNSAGAAGAPALAFDYAAQPMPAPRKYAVEAGKTLAATAPWPAPYDVVVHAPNGWVRAAAGSACAGAEGAAAADVLFDPARGKVLLALAGPATYTITDEAYGSGGPWTVPVPAGGALWAWDAAPSAFHYDLSVALAGAPAWARRAMGRMETGVESTSDPAGPTARALHPFAAPAAHPDVPEALRQVPRRAQLTPEELKQQGGALHKDMTLSQRFAEL